MEDDGTRREPTVNASRRRRRLLLARAEKTSPIPREGKRDKSAGAQGAYSLSNEPGTGRGKRRVVVRQSRDHGNRNANIPLPRAPSTPNRPHHCAPSSPACARTRRHRPQRDPSSLKIRENASFSCTFSRKWCPGGGNGGETTVWVPTPCSCVLGPLGDVVRARRGDLRRVPRGRLGSKARVLQRGGRARRMTAACLELWVIAVTLGPYVSSGANSPWQPSKAKADCAPDGGRGGKERLRGLPPRCARLGQEARGRAGVDMAVRRVQTQRQGPSTSKPVRFRVDSALASTTAGTSWNITRRPARVLQPSSGRSALGPRA